MIASITIPAITFFSVAASFVLVGAWCAAIEITVWRNRRRIARRRAARGGVVELARARDRRLP